MKKVVVFVLALMMLVAMTACSQGTPSATATPDQSAQAPTGGAGWSLKVGDCDLGSTAVDESAQSVTQTLSKISKDGSLKDQVCTGYKLIDLLDMADVTDFVSIVVVAEDGYEYEISKDDAILDTTMVVVEQDGETYEIPRFAVDGAGSDAWVKDIVELRIVEE